MFEILFALFGGAYYAARIASDKSASKEYDRQSKSRIAWHNERQERWRARVVDRALEEDLTDFIADPRNYDKVWEEVQSAYQKIPFYKDSTQILLYDYMIVARFGKKAFTKKQRENIAASHKQDALEPV